MIEPSSGEQAGIEGGADSDVKYLSPATLIIHAFGKYSTHWM